MLKSYRERERQQVPSFKLAQKKFAATDNYSIFFLLNFLLALVAKSESLHVA